ncbi:organic hydroperoxide resistance protein [Methylotenera sp.]|uniref:organic hydroperoxide resistance protein n=1 Tax=Methylotenera sp. TaxID=2051956 RepID=UPI002488CE27|nr:organic hydroperoxide resistance protein [Methylotenera sp.]MDI1360555.1 organic hydroperoxide resistance protein [Methylotenera sp.]
MTIEKVLYRGHARATGGREGQVIVPECKLTLNLTTPKELGGLGGEGANPEQLFAAGYSACFLSTLKLVAGQDKVIIPSDASIESTVGIGVIPNGFGIEVDLKISLPGMSRYVAEALVNKAHIVCPYSNATHGNIDVRLTVI